MSDNLSQRAINGSRIIWHRIAHCTQGPWPGGCYDWAARTANGKSYCGGCNLHTAGEARIQYVAAIDPIRAGGVSSFYPQAGEA